MQLGVSPLAAVEYGGQIPSVTNGPPVYNGILAITVTIAMPIAYVNTQVVK